jgi:GT2 family glycosyltransferase
VIIPTFERGDIAAQTLQRVLRETYAPCEFIVVDQSPELSAALRETVAAAGDKVRLVRPRSVGPPCARNAGIREARGEFLVFIDDDMEPVADFIPAFLRPFADDKVGAVAGRIIEPDAMPKVTHRGVIGDSGWFGNKDVGLDSTQRGPALTFKGGFFALRRSAAMQAGGFDEGFVVPSFREECDLAARMIQNGWKVVFEPDACARHLKIQTGGTHLPREQRQRLILENETRYAVRHLHGLRLCCWLLGRWRAMVLPRWNLTKPLLVARLSGVYWTAVWRNWWNRAALRRPVNYLEGMS